MGLWVAHYTRSIRQQLTASAVLAYRVLYDLESSPSQSSHAVMRTPDLEAQKLKTYCSDTLGLRA